MENCRICGKPIDADHYNEKIRQAMLDEGLCFHCHFWAEQHNLDINGDENGPREFAIIKGTHYVLCPHTDINWPKGHGGQKFYIKFADGRVKMCDNLWCQGDIPAEFKEQMPDNAEFTTLQEYLNQF